MTHIHPDHANGLVDDAGAAIYPNAEIIVHEQETISGWSRAIARDDRRRCADRARNRINLKP